MSPIPYEATDSRCQVRNFFIVRSGFLQNKGSAGNGMVKLAAALDHIFGGGEKGTRVELEAWKDDPDATAEFIYRLGRKDVSPNIVLAFYSWGVGYGLAPLCRGLMRRGLRVHTAIVCDGVYYRWGRWWRAMTRSIVGVPIRIEVPRNVDRVIQFRQHTNRPAGHDLVLRGSQTTFEEHVLPIRHQAMDNAPRFHDRVLRVAEAVVEGRPDETLPMFFPFPDQD